jgi:hypothetical protein
MLPFGRRCSEGVQHAGHGGSFNSFEIDLGQ